MPDRPLLSAVLLRDGRRISTVGDAVCLIAGLPEEQREGRNCDRALHALHVARRNYATFLDLEMAYRELISALRGEGLL
jgi:PAS domain-containing protein